MGVESGGKGAGAGRGATRGAERREVPPGVASAPVLARAYPTDPHCVRIFMHEGAGCSEGRVQDGRAGIGAWAPRLL